MYRTQTASRPSHGDVTVRVVTVRVVTDRHVIRRQGHGQLVRLRDGLLASFSCIVAITIIL